MIFETLQAERQKLGKSYQKVADDSGVPHMTVYRFLTGEHATSVENAELIAKALDYEIVLKKID